MTMTAPPTAARIFLADQRGCLQTTQHQRLSTLSFGEYQAEGRGPVGRLLAFNEESLAGGAAVTFPVAQATHLLLLPVVGALTYLGPAGLLGSLDVEQALVLALPAGSTVQLRNPYEGEVITFLHIWLSAGPLPPTVATAQHFEYRFDNLQNQLAEVLPASVRRPFSLHLGRFEGRHEAAHRAATPGNALFAFVLAGAFELENRLLHAGDALALPPGPEAELEALSNNALVLLLEISEMMK